jgi:hypothetical protein
VDGHAADGSSEFVAQVIALGDNQYRMNVLKAFDERATPVHVMEGSLQENKYTYTADGGKYRGECVLEGESCKGWYKGDPNGQFEMTRIVRPSQTLGARPSEGAVVLFDGTNFDRWVGLGGPRRGQYHGSSRQCSERRRPPAGAGLVLEKPGGNLLLGSDDGVKVWLNGKLVPRQQRPAARPVSIRQGRRHAAGGVNNLLLKVTNGGGDWGRLPLVGRTASRWPMSTRLSPQFASDKGSSEHRQNDGF